MFYKCLDYCYCVLCDPGGLRLPASISIASFAKTMEFPWHSGKVLDQLNHQRKQGLLCDCTFVVDGVDFKAHKAVLAACSVYFRALFLEQKDVVHLDISNAAGWLLPPCAHVLFHCVAFGLHHKPNLLCRWLLLQGWARFWSSCTQPS